MPSHSEPDFGHLKPRVATYIFDAPAGWEHEMIEVVHTGRVDGAVWNPLADVWAIRKRGWCWSKDDEQWEHEPLPSSRDDEFYARCRFTLAEAMPIAARVRDREISRRTDAR